MSRKLTYDRLGPNDELKAFVDARNWTCPTCGGSGEYESGYGPKGCPPCCSRLLFFVDDDGKRQELDWGDSVIIEDDGSFRIERANADAV